MGKLKEALECGLQEFVPYRDELIETERNQGNDPNQLQYFIGTSIAARYDVALIYRKMNDEQGAMKMIKLMDSRYAELSVNNSQQSENMQQLMKTVRQLEQWCLAEQARKRKLALKAYAKPAAMGLLLIGVAAIATFGVLKFRERSKN